MPAPIKSPAPGVYRDVPAETYFAWDAGEQPQWVPFVRAAWRGMKTEVVSKQQVDKEKNNEQDN